MQITEEQRRRIQENRLVALERRKRFLEASAGAAAGTSADLRLAKCPRIAEAGTTAALPTPCTTAAEWTLAKCTRTAPAPRPPLHPPPPPPQPPVGFQVVLEVCSSDEFSVSVGPVQGATYPGEAECLRAVQDCLTSASVGSHGFLSTSGVFYTSTTRLL
jgi:hypothetical protein